MEKGATGVEEARRRNAPSDCFFFLLILQCNAGKACERRQRACCGPARERTSFWRERSTDRDRPRTCHLICPKQKAVTLLMTHVRMRTFFESTKYHYRKSNLESHICGPWKNQPLSKKEKKRKNGTVKKRMIFSVPGQNSTRWLRRSIKNAENREYVRISLHFVLLRSFNRSFPLARFPVQTLSVFLRLFRIATSRLRCRRFSYT